MTHSHFEMRMQSQPRYLCVARAALETLAKQYGLHQNEVDPVVLAVDEAMTNIIRHGYKDATDKPILIRINPLDDALGKGIEIILEDECVGVDLTKIRGRDLKQVRPGGLGVHILYKTMDTVEFTHRQDAKGVRLALRKYHQPTAPAVQEGS